MEFIILYLAILVAGVGGTVLFAWYRFKQSKKQK